ncbi:CND2 protein, partial [Brachypteracias leptosomus]|nr:CND2 protein [Brachypteracias leptosomus]
EIDSDVKDSASALPGDDIQSDSPRNSVVEKIGEFSENLNSFGIVCQNKKTGVALSREGDISAISQHLSMKRGEYSYFSPQTLLSWAGPEHQQFKADAGTKRKTKKRSAKKAFEWNLDEDTDFKPYFRKAKTSTTLSKSVQERQKVKSITLPPQSNYDPDNFLQLFLQPTVKLNRISELGRVGDCEDEIDDYNYNNPNNTSNFCPDLQAADSDDNYSIQSMDQMGEFNLATDIEGENAEPNAINLTTRGELSLIAEPQKIKTTAIPYVKTAKKIDMSLLRKSMWDLLTNGQKEETVTEMDEEDTSVIAGEKAISSITKELLQTLPSQMAQNLSVPMVFACLLHLASEKNLILEGTEDLSDLLVKQGN